MVRIPSLFIYNCLVFLGHIFKVLTVAFLMATAQLPVMPKLGDTHYRPIDTLQSCLLQLSVIEGDINLFVPVV